MRLLPHPRHLLCPSVRVSTKTWWCWTLMSTILLYLLAWPAAWPATIPSTKHRSISLTATRRLSPRPSFVSSKISSGKHLHFLFGGFEIERGTERERVCTVCLHYRGHSLWLFIGWFLKLTAVLKRWNCIWQRLHHQRSRSRCSVSLDW